MFCLHIWRVIKHLMLIALDEHPIFVIRIPLPDILVHDGVVVADDAHLVLRAGVGVVAEVLKCLRPSGGGAARVLPGAEVRPRPWTEDAR